MIDINLLQGCFDNRILHLIILPTEKCNFRCNYCYEDFAIGKMKPDVINAIKHFIDGRLPDLEKFIISWFGGEPMLAFDTIIDIEQFISKRIAGKNIFHGSSMTTNGYYLNADKFRELIEYGVTDYQITLDGDKENHDKIRTLTNGKGSYDVIIQNLIDIHGLAGDFRITIRVHYSRDNINEVENTLEDLNAKFGSDNRFNFHLRAIEHLGSKNDDKIDIITGIEMEEFEKNLKSRLRDRIAIYEAPEKYICYASKPNSFVIRANGKLAKCTVAMYDEKNDIGNINIDGTLSINNARLQKWFSGFEKNDFDILACPVSYVN